MEGEIAPAVADLIRQRGWILFTSAWAWPVALVIKWVCANATQRKALDTQLEIEREQTEREVTLKYGPLEVGADEEEPPTADDLFLGDDPLE